MTILIDQVQSCPLIGTIVRNQDLVEVVFARGFARRPRPDPTGRERVQCRMKTG